MAAIQKSRLCFVLPALLLSLGLAWACGMQYWLILSNRDQTLMDAPDYYVHDLVEDLEDDGLIHAPSLAPIYTDGQWQYDGLSQVDYKQTLVMRDADSGDEAYALGDGLPEDVRLYTAGAVDFHQAQFDKARQRFEAVLALPPERARLRSAWAAYMLGIMYSAVDAPELVKDEEEMPDKVQKELLKQKSLDYFKLTRQLVAQEGVSDTENLALDSLGQEARVYIWPCRWIEGVITPDNTCAQTLSADDFKQALHLYLTQLAAQKEKSAVDFNGDINASDRVNNYDDNDGLQEAYDSLQYVADFVLLNEDLLAALLQDEVSRRFLLSYIFYQQNRLWMVHDYTQNYGGHYLNALDHVLAQNPNIDLGREGAMLAVLTYRHGRYEQAQRFAQQAKGPVAAWVRAKLALQRGDETAAAKEYAQVIEAFKQNTTYTSGIPAADQSWLYAESSILALSRGDYLEAMLLMFGENNPQKFETKTVNNEAKNPADAFYTREWLKVESKGSKYSYNLDIAYIAERLLTLDELKQFVDHNFPKVIAPIEEDCPDGLCWDDYQALELRWLLARRLVREGRYEEAAPYFPKTNDRRVYLYYENDYKDVDLAALAKTYGDELKASKDFWQTDISRAEHLFNAARIARYNGLEIMGYALDPDYAILGGNSSGLFESPLESKDKWIREGERQRYKETAPKVDERFHYRYVAIDLAEQAADKVPARSQAFAAMLCQAAFWDKNGYKDFRERLYLRYIKEGAVVPWAFVQDQCPAPDFDKARRDIWKFRLWLPMEEYARIHPLRFRYGLVAGGLLIVVLGFCLWRWRKSRKMRQTQKDSANESVRSGA